ncbi:hypothetical protein C4577_06570 [Candidatus Parcubacteria bacterium]|nr:MAG: hypothetical protein C4577_06570 [Candidatus Parcubacteria bacterium]
MNVHLYRIVDGGMIYIQSSGWGFIGTQYPYPLRTTLDWAIATARYMMGFYLRHGVKAEYVVGVEKGWTVEYFPVT